MTDKIYVQIASYRDPELLPTIRDCIKRADNPENLVFGIAWQHSKDDEWDTLEEYKDDPRFRIIDIEHDKAEGTCWARHLLNEAYQDEKYTLQLDSHHRFDRGWDTRCINMINKLVEAGYSKPILTSYIASYDPEDDPGKRVKEVWRLNFDRFTPEGVIFMLPAQIEDIDIYELPVPTRFFSAHFMFTFGQFIKDVPYDPNLYFHGEEITMAVRAYTHGYDLFVPNELLCWHEYTRKGRVRHWDEKDNGWQKRNDASLKRSKQLLEVDGDKADYDFGKYGFGTVRTKKDYEEYAGIRFEDRAVQQYTLDHYDPPNPIYRNEIARQRSYKNIFRHCIDIWKESLPEPDYDFWAIIFKDENDQEIYREDADRQEIKTIMDNPETKDGEFYNIWRQFDTKKKPYKWIVWPHSESKDWCDPIEGVLPRV